MSDSERAELRAFRELETLVHHLGEELASFRRRALQAETRLKDGPAAAGTKSAVSSERAHELEQENATLRDRLTHAEERVTRMLERVRFLRQQTQIQPARVEATGTDGR
jgi:predicted  nucleic acid-binding Zn-ribbon protein